VRKRDKSQWIAIDVDPPFDRLIFVERRPPAVEALNELREQHPDRNIEVIAGDANVEIPRRLKSVNWRRIRAVMFLSCRTVHGDKKSPALKHGAKVGSFP
jgi:three-Cys-motif partner protein